MKKLPLTPFTDAQNKQKYSINEFSEAGQRFAMLIPKQENERYAVYRFGVKDHDGNYFWFFGGSYCGPDRKKARETYSLLVEYNKQYNVGTVFASK